MENKTEGDQNPVSACQEGHSGVRESWESSDGNEEGMKLLLYEQIPATTLWKGKG